MIQHPIPPVYNENSTVLILGSFPSVKSREACFFYGHPQNRFWKVLAAVFAPESEKTLTEGRSFPSGVWVPQTTEEKRDFLLKNGIAVWDVIASCEITGSADSSIRNIVPNDLSRILAAAQIRQIFTNGKKADELYRKHIHPVTGRAAVCLPSTSPANAAWSAERLTEAWRCVREAQGKI